MHTKEAAFCTIEMDKYAECNQVRYCMIAEQAFILHNTGIQINLSGKNQHTCSCQMLEGVLMQKNPKDVS